MCPRVIARMLRKRGDCLVHPENRTRVLGLSVRSILIAPTELSRVLRGQRETVESCILRGSRLVRTFLYILLSFLFSGASGGAVGWGTALQSGMSRVRFPMVSLEFFIDIILPGRTVDSASNRNEYQEYFLGSKGGRCVRLTTLPPSCADCPEIWEP